MKIKNTLLILCMGITFMGSNSYAQCFHRDPYPNGNGRCYFPCDNEGQKKHMCQVHGIGCSTNNSSTSTTPSGAQGAVINGAEMLGAAMGTAFVNWLFKPKSSQKQTQLELQQQQAQLEAWQKQLEKIAVENARQQQIKDSISAVIHNNLMELYKQLPDAQQLDTAKALPDNSADLQFKPLNPAPKTSKSEIINHPVEIRSFKIGVLTTADVFGKTQHPPGTTYQWYKDGVAILNPAAQQYEFTPTEAGLYTVTITDSGKSISSAPYFMNEKFLKK